jgi:hypothetical protein
VARPEFRNKQVTFVDELSCRTIVTQTPELPWSRSCKSIIIKQLYLFFGNEKNFTGVQIQNGTSPFACCDLVANVHSGNDQNWLPVSEQKAVLDNRTQGRWILRLGSSDALLIPALTMVLSQIYDPEG